MLLACVLALQVSFLIVQLSRSIEDVHEQVSAALSEVNRTLAIVRTATEQQRGSYAEMARYSAQSLAGLSRLIERTDERMERLTPAAEELLRQATRATQTATNELGEVGEETRQALHESQTAIAGIRQLANAPEFRQSAGDIARSAANLERMSAAAADSAERVREMLSPARKGFWRRLLELMIPRPTVHVGK